MIDVTASIMEIVAESQIGSGICFVHVPHTTAGITINENADPAVTADIVAYMNKLVPNSTAFKHAEGNSDAHIKASLVGFSAAVFVENSSPVLGVWQGIYFCEFDGPRHRQMAVKVVADA